MILKLIFVLGIRSASSFLYVYPPGMRGMLKWIKNTYNNPTVIVTENGVSDHTGTLDDQPRIDYLKAYINELIKGTYIYPFLLIYKLIVVMLNKLCFLFIFFNYKHLLAPTPHPPFSE